MGNLSNNPPWQEKGVSYKARYFSKLGLIFLSILLAFSVGGVILGLSFLLDTPNDFWKEGFPVLLISAVLTGTGIFILIKLIKTMRSSISFIPSYGQVSPRELGHPFDVWYEQPEFHQQSLDGEGKILFDTSGLILEGTFSRVQGGMISSLISLLAQRKEVSTKVSYEDITQLTVKGRRIRFNIEDNKDHLQIIFYVSEMDGERMYRELKKYFPSAVAQYII